MEEYVPNWQLTGTVEGKTVKVVPDGDKCFASDEDFVNLQESIHYGFGDDVDKAIEAYLKTFEK